MFYVMIDTENAWGYDVEVLFEGTAESCIQFIANNEWQEDEHPWIENESGDVIE